MASLEEYLSTDYLINRQEISDLDAEIAAAARTLHETKSVAGWSYSHSFGAPAPGIARKSTGTTAMVLAAIGRILNQRVFGLDGEPVQLPGKLATSLEQDFGDAFVQLAKDVEADHGLMSDTFGNDNPITFSHLADLLQSTRPDILVDARARLTESTSKAFSNLEALLADPDVPALTTDAGEYQSSAFVPLRAVRTATVMGIDKDLSAHRAQFETTLHAQLSFSSIPDSRFDPAELVFSLEGMLHCNEHSVDAAVMHRVLEVLADKQNTSSHWRPSKPFLASATGSIMLPVSVEVANSLLRSVDLMDRGRTHGEYTAKALPLLRRFWAWIQARAVRGRIQQGMCLGWHSEHINDPGVVHVWDTSLVVEFMTGYRSMLERDARDVTLRLSGLLTIAPEVATSEPMDEWMASTHTFDASPNVDASGELDIPPTSVYARIGVDFVAGWSAKAPQNFSMLLYGPPGTGKTSIASELAKALGMSLIVVTVGDFLGTGGANVEARAKAIFQTLSHQRDVVVLFDEIDSFLLDRDSAFYASQDSLFQFLTPGMLPKLQDLRKGEKCIFIIATNYENRIDPAIKRTGRIDQAYLVPLPNAAKRRDILVSNGIDASLIDADVARASVYLGFGDLRKVARNIHSTAKGADLRSALIAALEEAQRASTLIAYLERAVRDNRDFAGAEFDDMVRLATEADAHQRLDEAGRFVRGAKSSEALEARISTTSRVALGIGDAAGGES